MSVWKINFRNYLCVIVPPNIQWTNSGQTPGHRKVPELNTEMLKTGSCSSAYEVAAGQRLFFHTGS